MAKGTAHRDIKDLEQAPISFNTTNRREDFHVVRLLFKSICVYVCVLQGAFFTEKQKGLTSLISSACSMTSVNPLSWSEESSDGS